MKDNTLAPDPAAPLMARVAARVRDARKARGMPRRELSERSGVSPRYLAQLEAGEGNISIALLQRIAMALDERIEALLSETEGFGSDLHRVMTLYVQSPAHVQDEVRRVLAVENPAALKASRICLIGLRGAGKSTLGKLAGAALNLPFVELNTEIEEQIGMPLPEVLALYGEEGYRELEATALSRVVARHDRMILAVAGGIVSGVRSYQMLLERFHSVWVQTSPAEHMQRVRAQGDLRPMEGNPEAMKQLRALLDARTPLYEKADARINTSNKTVTSSLNDLLAVIASNRFLEVPEA